MSGSNLKHLSRRERQIMEILYRAGKATATEVLAALPDPPGYSAVRALLKVLENKGQIRHVLQDMKYVWLPVVPREKARRSALENVLETFFDGSPEKAVATLLDMSKTTLSDEELERLSRLIHESRKEGR